MQLIILECHEIFTNIEGNAKINRWRSILDAGKVYHNSELLVDAATDEKRNVVNNNLKLVFNFEIETSWHG